MCAPICSKLNDCNVILHRSIILIILWLKTVIRIHYLLYYIVAQSDPDLRSHYVDKKHVG